MRDAARMAIDFVASRDAVDCDFHPPSLAHELERL